MIDDKCRSIARKDEWIRARIEHLVISGERDERDAPAEALSRYAEYEMDLFGDHWECP